MDVTWPHALRRRRRSALVAATIAAGLGAAVLCGPAAPAAAAAPAAVREPAFAGGFYPDDPARLRSLVRDLLAAAEPTADGRPLALVAPHAGYAYSGRICADAWAQAAGRHYDVVVILGTNHRLGGFDRVSVWPGAWRTPLGVAPADTGLARALLDSGPDVVEEPRAHAREHSVEVQVPFAQIALPGTPVVGVVIGVPDPELCRRFGRALAATLRRLGRRALIVASSDLAHYPPEEEAVASDLAVLRAVTTLDAGAVRRAIAAEMGRGRPGLATCACGEGPILVAIAAARALGAERARIVAHATSADVPQGDPGRVVGYGAVAILAPDPDDAPGRDGAPDPVRPGDGAPEAGAGTLGPGDRAALLALARAAIRDRLEGAPAPPLPLASRALLAPRGAFVTLEEDGRLRGCIGHMAEDLPLWEAVRDMAVQAAFGDPRFPPLRPDELSRIAIEVSALTPARPVAGPEAIVLGRDGIVLRRGGRSAVFLPQVAPEQGWTLEETLSHLCRKAGLPAGCWRRDCELLTFRAVVFGEDEGR